MTFFELFIFSRKTLLHGVRYSLSWLVGWLVGWLLGWILGCLFICGNMSAISISNLVGCFDQVRLKLTSAMKCHDNCGVRFVLCDVFSEISDFRPGP